MHRYDVVIVDGRLAIQWDDETREQAAERARKKPRLSPLWAMPRREARGSRARWLTRLLVLETLALPLGGSFLWDQGSTGFST